MAMLIYQRAMVFIWDIFFDIVGEGWVSDAFPMEKNWGLMMAIERV